MLTRLAGGIGFGGKSLTWDAAGGGGQGDVPLCASSCSFLVAQIVENLPALGETQVRSLGREDPLEEGMANPLQYSCLENSMDRNPGRLQCMGLQRVRHD